MKAGARSRPDRRKRSKRPTETTIGPINTFAGRLAWSDERPALTWEAGGRPRGTGLDPAHLSPGLRDPHAGETAVSFELADGIPVHVRKAGEQWRILVCVLG